MMKKLVVATGVACGLALATSANAADKVTIQLKWVTQAQFAGYYVAKAKGYYKDADLDVTINPGGPDVAPPQVIAGGGADVVVDWMPSALASREKGVPLVNISQTFKKSGLELTCRADTGIKSPKDFKGKTLGVWFGGNEYPFLAWMAKLGLKTDGSPGGVKVIKQGFNVDPLLQKQADCISTMTYNEYWQVIDAGYKPEPARGVQIHRRRRGDAGRRPLCDGSQAQGPGVRRQDGEVREGLGKGLGLAPRTTTRKPPRSCSPPTPPARRRCITRSR